MVSCEYLEKDSTAASATPPPAELFHTGTRETQRSSASALHLLIFSSPFLVLLPSAPLSEA